MNLDGVLRDARWVDGKEEVFAGQTVAWTMHLPRARMIDPRRPELLSPTHTDLVDPANLTGIFGPFFITTPRGMGTGLSICRSIVAAQGGVSGRRTRRADRPFTFNYCGSGGSNDAHRCS
jgi:hypothetical protein